MRQRADELNRIPPDYPEIGEQEITPLPTNPPPTPKLVTLKCSSCSYSYYGGSGSSGNIPQGAYVTVTGYTIDSSLGRFVFDPSSACSQSGVQIRGSWDSDLEEYVFTVSFSIRSDTTVYFSGVIN